MSDAPRTLRELVVKWRKPHDGCEEDNHSHDCCCAAWDECADELDAAIAAATPDVPRTLRELDYAADRWLKVNANNYSAKLVASLQQELRLALAAATPPESMLRELAMKWRTEAKSYLGPTGLTVTVGRAGGLGDCADELEAALAAATPEQNMSDNLEQPSALNYVPSYATNAVPAAATPSSTPPVPCPYCGVNLAALPPEANIYPHKMGTCANRSAQRDRQGEKK